MRTILFSILSFAAGALVSWGLVHSPRLSSAEQAALLKVVSLRAICMKHDGRFSRTDLGLGEMAHALPDSQFKKKLESLSMAARFVTTEDAERDLAAECEGVISIYSRMAAK